MSKAKPRGTNRSLAASSPEIAVSDAVLVVSRDGIIRSFISTPDAIPDSKVQEFVGSSTEKFWPLDLAQLVHSNVKRTLRSRKIHRVEFHDDLDGGHYEIIVVAQARDRAMVVVRDVSEEKSALSKMKHLAYGDDVTGLPNREYLLKELDKITTGLRLSEGRAAVIRFDIDQLDLVESASGRSYQDEILQALSDRLTRGLRGVNQPETADQERFSLVARIDYRQFAVVLPAIEAGSDAEAVSVRLSESMEQPVKIGSREFTVTVSSGIALFPQDGLDATTLFENAGAAATDAKNSLTTRQRLHSGTVKVRALKRQDLELELKSALDRDQFDLNYLPIVQAESRKPVTLEALLRWPQTVFGVKSTKKLVSLAEYTGLIIPIGDWVLRRGCADLHAWHACGHPDMRLAVNLSVQEFSRTDLVKRIADILDENSVDPGFIDIEITEHILFRDAMRKFVTCKALKELGVRVIVDDYGTGACSLTHLALSPIDAIKIDGSFISNLDTDPAYRAACAAAIKMAHALGLTVVAECIETEEQAAVLQNQGCDFLQGFLFSLPESATEIGAYLGRLSESQADSDSSTEFD